MPPLFGHRFPKNQVLPKEQVQSIVKGLLAKKNSNEPVIFQDTYRVHDNPFYGIEGGWNVEVLWVYNERVTSWESALREEIKNMIGRAHWATSLIIGPFSKTPTASLI